jgi:hypothetical protein
MFSGMIGQAGDCDGCRGELPQDGSNAQIWSMKILKKRSLEQKPI